MIISTESRLLKVIHREWQRITSGRPLLFITIIGPLISFLLISLIFINGVPRDLPVAIVDLDHTALSRQMIRMIDATPIAKVDRNYISLNDARKATENGTVDAVLCIPEGSERDLYRAGYTKVALYLNNVNVIKGGLLNSGIRKALGTLSAGIKLQMQLKNGYGQTQISRIMPVQLNQVMLFNPYTSYAYYLTIGLMPVILIVFVLLGTIYTIGDELYKSTGPKWLRAAGKNVFVAVIGKLLPYTFIYFCIAMVMNIILFRYVGVSLNGKYHIIIFGEILLIISYQFMAVFFIAITSNMRLSLSIGSAYCMLALTYSGLTFPAMGMPVAGQTFSAIFPFTYWLKSFIGQSLRGEPERNGLLQIYPLILFIILGMMFIPRLKYLLLNRKHWGKI